MPSDTPMAAQPAAAPDGWFVAADGKSFGPYTEEQISAFIAEGRVGPTTPVMRSGGRWSKAGEHQDLAWIFGKGDTFTAPAPAAATPAPAPTPTPAPAPAATPAPAAIPATAAPVPESPAPEEQFAKVVIVAELRSGSTMAFEAAVSRLGKCYRLNQFVWLVHSNLPLAQIRKALLPLIGKQDPLFISDTTHGRAAWLNFGPGAEATIKALWRGAL